MQVLGSLVTTSEAMQCRSEVRQCVCLTHAGATAAEERERLVTRLHGLLEAAQLREDEAEVGQVVGHAVAPARPAVDGDGEPQIADRHAGPRRLPVDKTEVAQDGCFRPRPARLPGQAKSRAVVVARDPISAEAPLNMAEAQPGCRHWSGLGLPLRCTECR